MHKINYIVTSLLLLAFIGSGRAQSNFPTDSLELSEVIRRVIQNYPSILIAEQEIAFADARIGLAKSDYLPQLNFSASYTRLGPVSSMDIPGMGTFQLYPADNYEMGVNVHQLITDFGRTSKRVNLEKQNKQLSQLSVEQLKQQLSLSLLNYFYSMLYLQEAIKIKNEELKTLGEHLVFVEKKEATGSSTQYAVLSTQVRISATENQRVDLETSLQVLQAQMNSFLGNKPTQPVTVKEKLWEPVALESDEKLIESAYQQREELKVVRQRSDMASARLSLASASLYPVLDLFASGGFKNGYIIGTNPNLNRFTPNYAAGVSLKWNFFDGNRIKYYRQEAQSEINRVEQDKELISRNIANEIIENRTHLDAAFKKIQQQELQLRQAQRAYELAQTSFMAGTVTNLDLLDSETALAESRLALMKSKIDYTVNLLKLKIAMGEQIY